MTYTSLTIIQLGYTNYCACVCVVGWERHQPDMKIPIIIYSSINIKIMYCVLYMQNYYMCDMTWMVFGLFYSGRHTVLATHIDIQREKCVGRNTRQGGVQWTFIIIILCGSRATKIPLLLLFNRKFLSK